MYMLWFEGHIMHCFPPLHEGCKIATTLVAQKLLVTNHWFTAIYTISCMEYMLYGQGWKSLPHIIGVYSSY